MNSLGWESAWAAAVGGVFTLVGMFLSNRLKLQIHKDKTVSTNLDAQLEGWREYAETLRKEINDLRNDAREMRDRRNTQIEDLRAQITAAQEHIARCEQENADLRRRVRNLEQSNNKSGG